MTPQQQTVTEATALKLTESIQTLLTSGTLEQIEAQARWIAGQQLLNTATKNKLSDIEIDNEKRDKYIKSLDRKIVAMLIAQLITIAVIVVLAMIYL